MLWSRCPFLGGSGFRYDPSILTVCPSLAIASKHSTDLLFYAYIETHQLLLATDQNSPICNREGCPDLSSSTGERLRPIQFTVAFGRRVDQNEFPGSTVEGKKQPIGKNESAPIEIRILPRIP